MIFTIPTRITFSNRPVLEPGTLTDVYSINLVTGDFDLVGTARVTADDCQVETISGQVCNSSWQFIVGPSGCCTL
jgi:hypothetical protein